ncbi:RICIN domain-containing protein [Streptomyces sp. NPDC059534]|uniref:RICIN domain-containing protein n=1 Tax=Streptomyces sp. NPDC059534 TaxID=3346859 RepID=UPI00368DDCC5
MSGPGVAPQRDHRPAPVLLPGGGPDVATTAVNTCLDVTGNSSADGARARTWTCTGAADQKWTHQPF